MKSFIDMIEESQKAKEYKGYNISKSDDGKGWSSVLDKRTPTDINIVYASTIKGIKSKIDQYLRLEKR